MCSVVLEFEVLFILVTVAVSVLCYKCSLWYKVQFPRLLYTSFIVSSCVVGCGEMNEERENTENREFYTGPVLVWL